MNLRPSLPLALAACAMSCSGWAPRAAETAASDSAATTAAPPTPVAAPSEGSAGRDSASGAPDCASWPRSMAFVHLKNDGHLVRESTARVVRLASERTGPDLFRQVHRIAFVDSAGAPLTVITVSDASHEECSMSGVQVYVVARAIGDDPDRK